MLRWLAMVAVVALVASACGRSDNNASGDDSGGGGSSTTPTTAQQAAGSFGDIKEPICGPAKGTNTPNSDVGVTANSVQVSTFSDPGFVGRPGLNQELFDTATAFAGWCNAAGGINGRKIVLKKRDAKLTEFQQRVIEACQQKDFAMVGGGAVFDDTGQKERLACGLPTIAGYVVTPQASEADLTYQPVPNPLGTLSDGDWKWLGEQFPDATKKVAAITGAISTTQTVLRRYQEAMKDLGWKVVYSDTYNPNGESNWRPKAEGIKSSGAKALVWVGEPKFLGQLMKALSDIGYKLDFVRADANQYDPLLTSTAGVAADGVYVRSVFYPFLDPTEAKKNPATQQYLDIMNKYAGSNAKIALLGIQGLSAWVLFAKAASECGTDLTRDCVWQKIGQIHDWTGGGLQAGQDVGNSKPSTCFSELVVKGGQFQLADVHPNQGIYLCKDGDLLAIKGDYGSGAKCPNPAYASDPKPSNCGS
jgi:ABC-type branched-subunit amino acid transport system substrate-binding protein